MSRYNGNVTSNNIEDCLYYSTYDLIGIDPIKIDRFTKNFFEVLPSHDGNYNIILYKDRQILNKPSQDNIDLTALFVKPNGAVATDSNIKAFGKKIAKVLAQEFGFEFDVKPSRVTPKYSIQYIASIKKDEAEPKENKFEIKDEEPDTKDLTADSREIVTKGTTKVEESKKLNNTVNLVESFFDAQADDFIPADYEEHQELLNDLAANESSYDDFDSDWNDDNWTTDYTSEIDPDEDWDDEPSVNEYDDMEAFGYTSGHYNDRSDEDNFPEMFESVLKEGDCGAACDGAVTAGDFIGDVPENMGAVVQSDKKDKKYSSVFDD